MRKEIIEIEAKLDKAVDGVNDLKNSIDDLKKEGVSSAKGIEKGVDNIGKTAKKTEKSVGGLAKGFKGVGVAIKAAGIGLVIAALGTLKEVFTSNQRVADAFSVAFETVSLIFNEFANTIIDVYESVAKSGENFDALGKVIKGLLTLAITPLKLSFYAIKLTIQEAQLAWEKSFFGDKDTKTIADLNIGILETQKALLDAGEAAINAGKNVVINFGEAVGEFAEITTKVIDGVSKISIKGAYESAKANVQLKNTAQLAAAQQGLLVEKYDLLAEKQRQIRDEERNSIVDRKKANDELNKILDDQEKAMLAQANAQVAAAQAEVDKNASIENQVALTESLANKQGVLAQVEGFRSEQKMNDLALDREAKELTNAKLESESLLSIERKRFNAEQIEGRLQNLEANKEIDALEQEQETERLQTIIDNANAGTQAKVDAQIALDEFTEQSRQTNIARDKTIEDTKLAMVTSTLGNISKAFGESSKAGKAAAASASLINTYQGITAELATKTATPFGFALKLANIATTAAIGFRSVKNILKTNPKSSGSGVGSVSTASAPQAQASAPQAKSPSFNIVGGSDTNQLAGAIGQQEKKPIKAFMVSKDVSTAQEMDRNIIASASFG